LFLSHPAADRLGRRWAAFTGVFVTAVGAALQSGANGKGAYSLMIVGRIVCGLGLAVVSTSVPLYQRYVILFSMRAVLNQTVSVPLLKKEAVMWL
jgi:MFS family permease